MSAGSWSKSRLTTIAVVAILCAAGTAMAASGVSTLVTSGDDGAATAQGSQQALGTLSATPPPLTPSDNGTEEEVGGGGTPPPLTPSGEGTEGEVGGGTPNGTNLPGDTPNETLGVRGGGAPDTTSGSASSLPFTGYLVIPALLLGAVMLGTGVALRRRSASSAVSA